MNTSDGKALIGFIDFLLLVIIITAGCIFWPISTNVHEGEDARSLINKVERTEIPSSATDLYICHHRNFMDSFTYIGMTLPVSEGMRFLEKRARSRKMEKGCFEGWIERDLGPQKYGSKYRTDLWNPKKLIKPIRFSSGVSKYLYDQETGRLLISTYTI